MRWTCALLPIALTLSSCGTGIYVPDAENYVKNPFRDFSVKRAISINQDWDTALAPLSCTMFAYKNKAFVITGSVSANGVLFKDTAILDPSFVPAYSRKVAKHIGPNC